MGKKDIGDQNLNDEELDLEDEDQDEDEEDLEDDDQDEDDDEDQDDEDEKPSRKSSVSAKDIKDIKDTINDLRNAANKSGDSKDQKKVKKVDQIFQTWLSEGKKANDLSPLYSLMEALKEDLREEYEEAGKTEKAKTLDERSWDAMDTAFEKFARKNPAIGWSKAEITAKAYELMRSSKRYSDARDTYARGRVPAARHYEDAMARTIAVFEKETGKSSGAKKEAPQSLDIKNSRTKSKSSAVGDGEIDLNSLDAMERHIYTTTLNITKNKKLAREALKDLRGKL
ncbi:MAG: hypothetical protein C0469_07670 [Cyanobacteria bacterium DS2.3.42]|nr:hypothetical protein [Cyanobacteria bacterium DS2.3.42]